MSALPSAAAAIGSGFLTSLWQLGGNWLALIPLAVAVAIVLYLRRHSRTVPFPKEEIGPEEPMFYERGHVIGRDGREAVLRRARGEDRLEAEADAMAAEWHDQRGDAR